MREHHHNEEHADTSVRRLSPDSIRRLQATMRKMTTPPKGRSVAALRAWHDARTKGTDAA